jgi:hypothetical protein
MQTPASAGEVRSHSTRGEHEGSIVAELNRDEIDAPPIERFLEIRHDAAN